MAIQSKKSDSKKKVGLLRKGTAQIKKQKLRAKKFHQLNTKQRKKMIEDHMGLVTYIAKKYVHRNEPLDDLIQIGIEGLIKAINRYDEKFGVKFSTYATPTVDGEIRHYLRDKTSTVKVSRKLIELNTKINRFREEELQRTGNEPTYQEIAKELQVPQSKVEKAMKAVESHFTVSLDSPIYYLKGGSMNVCQLDDLLGKESFVEEVMNKELIKKAIGCLNPREREIISQHFFFDQIQEDLSKRFGVTQAQISRIISNSLKKMRETLAA